MLFKNTEEQVEEVRLVRQADAHSCPDYSAHGERRRSCLSTVRAEYEHTLIHVRVFASQ